MPRQSQRERKQVDIYDPTCDIYQGQFTKRPERVIEDDNSLSDTSASSTDSSTSPTKKRRLSDPSSSSSVVLESTDSTSVHEVGPSQLVSEATCAACGLRGHKRKSHTSCKHNRKNLQVPEQDRKAIDNAFLTLFPSAATKADALIAEFQTVGQNVRPRSGFLLPGSGTYSITNNFSISITSGDNNKDVPREWFPRFAQFINNVSERGAAALERGERHQNLHIQAVVTLRYPTVAKGDTKGKMLTALGNMIKDYFHLPTARAQQVQCKIVVKPMVSESHTHIFIHVGLKDFTRIHSMIAVSNVSSEELRAGLALYKSQSKAFYRGLTRLTKANFIQLAFNYWATLFDPYPVPLPKIILWMLQKQEAIPDVAWALSPACHPIDAHKAAAYWRIITMPGDQVQLADVAEFMFKTNHPVGTSLPFIARATGTIQDRSQPLFLGFSPDEVAFDHTTSEQKAVSIRLTTPALTEVTIPEDAPDHHNVVDVTHWRNQQFQVDTFYDYFRRKAAEAAATAQAPQPPVTIAPSPIDVSTPNMAQLII